MAIAVSTFLTAALAEIRVARAGDVLSPDDTDLALVIFNELLDALNADNRPLYSLNLPIFTLTPSLQPHTIGLAANTPTFAVTIARPQRIMAANLIIANNIRRKLDPFDDDQWMDIAARAITSAVPTHLYYSTDWPNGSIYLWPVPTTAYQIELQTSTLLAQVLLTDTFDLPPGYQQALRLTLAELLAAPFGQQVSPATAKNARDARAKVWAVNDTIPILNTCDAGMPGGSGGGFDFRTGEVR